VVAPASPCYPSLLADDVDHADNDVDSVVLVDVSEDGGVDDQDINLTVPLEETCRVEDSMVLAIGRVEALVGLWALPDAASRGTSSDDFDA
jgi:hypothetical protein